MKDGKDAAEEAKLLLLKISNGGSAGRSLGDLLEEIEDMVCYQSWEDSRRSIAILSAVTHALSSDLVERSASEAASRHRIDTEGPDSYATARDHQGHEGA